MQLKLWFEFYSALEAVDIKSSNRHIFMSNKREVVYSDLHEIGKKIHIKTINRVGNNLNVYCYKIFLYK